MFEEGRIEGIRRTGRNSAGGFVERSPAGDRATSGRPQGDCARTDRRGAWGTVGRLRIAGTAGERRDGNGIQSQTHAAEPRGGAQKDSPREPGFGGTTQAFLARGGSGGAVAASAHRRVVRDGRGRTPSLSRHGVCAGQGSRISHTEDSSATTAGARLR